MYASFWLRFDGNIPSGFSSSMVRYCALALVIKFTLLALHGMYGFSWRFFGLQELQKLLQAVLLSSLFLAVSLFLVKSFGFSYLSFPRSVILLDLIFTLGFLGGLRISKGIVRDHFIRKKNKNRKGIRVLIIGAGEAGRQIVKEMQSSRGSKYIPVGFVDDDPAKQGLSIQGEKVLGTRVNIPALMKEYRVDEALVAMPSAASKDIKEIVLLLRESNGNKKIKILPSVIDLMERDIALKDIQEVKVEDLLGRAPVTIDYDSIRRFLMRKRVLITGAAGSIGSELTRAVLQFEPAELVTIDIDETETFYLLNRVQRDGNSIIPVIGDIRDEKMIQGVFDARKPQIVIHSAAYKHVPILERFAGEAVKTNILATRSLGEIALQHGVEKFVFISTDKAINPTSVMGASKRIAEEILRALNGRNGTKFISVRFGNVLGSRGSVIPLFKEQIQRGGPVTVTHPGMRRYFMATNEAVLLVLEAAAAGEGGEVFVLDMGNPVKIEDLAKEMIRLSGFEPGVEIPIIFTGLRPGEKLFEELIGDSEETEPLKYDKIYKLIGKRNGDERTLFEQVDVLKEICASGCSKKDIIERFLRIVPSYKPDMNEGSNVHWW
jgi:FlaA1/EpsC-like NDP-sugar epimerase